MQAATFSRFIVIVAGLLLISACTQMPERPAPTPDDADLARAADLMSQQQYPAAYELYRQ